MAQTECVCVGGGGGWGGGGGGGGLRQACASVVLPAPLLFAHI